MNSLTFDDYAYHARNTAYYLDLDDQQQHKIIHNGFNEEVGELLTDDTHPEALTSKLWGLPIDDKVSTYFDQTKLSEAGDILYFISAAASLRGVQLRDIALEAIKRFTSESGVTWDESITGFDAYLTNQIDPSVPQNYKPNYAVWKLWDFAPFEDGLHITLRDPIYAKGPLRLIPDARYALESLHSTLARNLHPKISDNETFTSAASLALGSLSIILQGRFNGSLYTAAQNNIAKRERRQLIGALENGTDHERSRKPTTKRKSISDEENTFLNLLNAPQPEL